jgi:hypothetical protein
VLQRIANPLSRRIRHLSLVRRARADRVAGRAAGRVLAHHDIRATPGFGSGQLDAEGNFAHYVDRLVLGTHN